MSEQERAASQTALGVVETDRDAVAREIGAQLKEGREAQRLSLEDVSARLKVAAPKLAAIESGNVSSLPDVTFAKGVMRAYARTLHIDIDPLLGRYHAQAQTAPVAEITRRHEGSLNQAFDDRKRFGSSTSSGSGGRLIWLLLVVAGLAAGGWFGYDHFKAWLDARSQHVAEVSASEEAATQTTSDGTVTATLPTVMTGNDSPAPSEAPAVTSPVPPTTAATSATSATATPSAPSAPTTASGMPLATGGALAPSVKDVPAPSTAPAPAAAATAATATPAAAAGGDVELRFSGDTWYEVRDRNGKVVLGGTAKAGDVVAGAGAAPYKLVIGNVKGVESVRRNGAPVDFKSADRNNVARMTLQ